MKFHVSGVQTRFEQAAEFEVRRIWCGIYELYLALRKKYNALHDYPFVNTLTGLIGYLRVQQKFQKEMKISWKNTGLYTVMSTKFCNCLGGYAMLLVEDG